MRPRPRLGLPPQQSARRRPLLLPPLPLLPLLPLLRPIGRRHPRPRDEALPPRHPRLRRPPLLPLAEVAALLRLLPPPRLPLLLALRPRPLFLAAAVVGLPMMASKSSAKCAKCCQKAP